MKTKRGLYQNVALLLAALTVSTALTACKLGRSSDDQQPEVVPTDPAQAGIGDVVRYTGMEVADTGGQASVRQTVTARKAADLTSNIIATLRPGTVVSRLARYGNYSLVSWVGLGAAQQGWVDTNLAFAVPTTPRVVADAGVPVFGTIGTPPVTAPPVATVPATTTAPPPPPTTTAPPPTTTAPPPTTTAPSKPGPVLTARPRPIPKTAH